MSFIVYEVAFDFSFPYSSRLDGSRKERPLPSPTDPPLENDAIRERHSLYLAGIQIDYVDFPIAFSKTRVLVGDERDPIPIRRPPRGAAPGIILAVREAVQVVAGSLHHPDFTEEAALVGLERNPIPVRRPGRRIILATFRGEKLFQHIWNIQRP